MSSEELGSETFQPLLRKLVSSPGDFTAEDTRRSMEHLFVARPLTSDAQIGAFYTAVHDFNLELRADVLAAAADVLRNRAVIPPTLTGRAGEPLVVGNIVGTGGDGKNVFNVSTAAGIVAAGAGLCVRKIGAGRATSLSGASDIMRSLGCKLDKLWPARDHDGFSYAHGAALWPFPVFGIVGKNLPFRTLNNLVGPLAMPPSLGITHALLGVATPDLGQVYADALLSLYPDARSLKRVWVVCGDEGLDEISCAGPTHVWDVNIVARTIRTHTIIPEDFGLPRHPLDHVRGGTSDENAATLERLLQSDSGSGDLDAVRDFVCMNAAALLVLAGEAENLCHGVALARESVKSGRAWTAFAHFRDWTCSWAGQVLT